MPNKFVSLMDTIESDVMKGLKLAGGGSTVIVQAGGAVAQGVTDIKALFNLFVTIRGALAASKAEVTPDQKIAAVAPSFSTTFQDVELIAGNKITNLIKDQAKFEVGIQQITQGFETVLQSCGE